MNGKLQSSDVKNETPYNIPLLINENVISSGISLISLWHTYADEHYRVIWPRDKKKPLIANSWVAVYTVQGCGKILLKNECICRCSFLRARLDIPKLFKIYWAEN